MASAEQYADWIVRNQDKQGTPEFDTVVRAYRAVRGQASAQPPLTADPTDGMSGTDKFLAGAGKAMTDLARGAGQLVGAVDRSDVAATRKLDAPLMKTGAGMAGNVAGNIATLAPTALLPGANTITGGAVIGSLTGLLQPSASTGETVGNVLLGGGAGAAVPAAVRGFRVARAAAEPFHERGRHSIVGRALNRAAGPDAATVAARLRESSRPFVGPSQGTQRTVMGEFVPGSVPTVGQAAEHPSVAALERAAVAVNPEAHGAVTNLIAQQNAARVGALDDMAGTNGAREFFGAARDATANQLYGEARRLGIDPAVLTPEVAQNIATFARRVPAPVLARARELAQINGDEMTNATSIQGLHWVKMAIDDLIGSADRAGNATLRRAYTGLQQDLLAGMDNLSPAYQAARQTYSAMSRPINQMDVAREIANRSVDPLRGNLRPAAFARALSDDTAARATGLPTATLDGTLDPAQRNVLNSILLDLRRADAAQNVGRGVGSDTVQKLAYANLLDESGVPTLVRSLSFPQFLGGVGGRAADMAYGRANRELGNRLAEVMLDPAMAAELMTQTVPRAANPLARALGRTASGLAIAAPASANARQK